MQLSEFRKEKMKIIKISSSKGGELLGLYIDRQLKLDKHIDYISKKNVRKLIFSEELSQHYPYIV